MKQNTASARIVAELRTRIRSGALQPGQRVPSAREIVKHWGVAIATATKVLALLRSAGLVRMRPGIGTVVVGERAPQLSRALVIQTAIAIADDEGTHALSMRSVARELGVATMSIYRHVASKEELLLLMADGVLAEIALPRHAPRATTWRRQLESIARQQWAGYRRHAWLAQTLSMTRPQLITNGMRQTELVLRALDTLQLGHAMTLRTGVAFLAYIRGMAVSLEAELEAEHDTGLSSDEWMATQEAKFAPLMPRFPTLAKLSREPVDMSIDALFECGMKHFLDGLTAK